MPVAKKPTTSLTRSSSTLTKTKVKKPSAKSDTKTLALVKTSKAKISKLDPSQVESILAQDVEKIQNMLEVNDNDTAVSLIYKRLIQSIVDLLPVAENNVRVTKAVRGIYQYNALIESLRSLILEMQAALDRGAMGEAVIDRILRPIFFDVATQIVLEWKKLELAAKGSSMSEEDFSEFKEELKNSRDTLAHLMERKFNEAKNQTREFLQR